MANKNGYNGKGKRHRAKHQDAKHEELRAENKRLREELARVRAERDGCLKSLGLLDPKRFSFTKKELREMRENPLGIQDVLDELRQEARKHG